MQYKYTTSSGISQPAELLAALYYSACLTNNIEWEELHFILRDFWREMLRHPPLDITDEILEET